MSDTIATTANGQGGTVLHIITGLETGGAERALYNLVLGGLAEHLQTEVVSLMGEGTMGPLLQTLGVPVKTLGMKQGRPTPAALRRLLCIVRGFRPDIIQGWMYHGNLAATLAAKFAQGRTPVAWNVRHTLYNLESERPFTRQIIRANRWLSVKPESVVYNSRVSMDQHTTYGFSGARAHVIPNGFDTDRLTPDNAAGVVVRDELGIPRGAVVVGHVARFHPMKDHQSFLRAAVQVTRRYPETVFLVVGRNVDLRNSALANIVPAELEGRFIFPGERSDAHRLMQAMDLFCMSSAWGDAFPNVLGEAMACGVPCVTTNVGDSPYIVGETGVIVEPGDAETLANGLFSILKKPAVDRRALGDLARLRIQKHYSLTRMVNQYLDLYRGLARSAAS